ncbi:MAG: ECF transporter S component [Clostridiales bacterium]|nr:ECF transporter S component [Clostridiales bacterium]
MKTSDEKIKRLAVHGIFTAIIGVLTLFASIPLPVGSGGAYLNAGDAAIFVSAFVLGPFGGAVTAAVGSALADVLHGAVVYAPATLVIKGLMGFLAGLLFKKSKYLAPPVSGLVMPAGYFVYELILYGMGTALYGLWTNAIQYAFGAVAGILTVLALSRTGITLIDKKKRQDKE